MGWNYIIRIPVVVFLTVIFSVIIFHPIVIGVKKILLNTEAKEKT